MKKHKPIHNLGAFAHPPKANQNYARPTRAQTRPDSAKLIGKAAGGTGKKGKA
jgi:hypothetical protein